MTYRNQAFLESPSWHWNRRHDGWNKYPATVWHLWGTGRGFEPGTCLQVSEFVRTRVTMKGLVCPMASWCVTIVPQAQNCDGIRTAYLTCICDIVGLPYSLETIYWLNFCLCFLEILNHVWVLIVPYLSLVLNVILIVIKLKLFTLFYAIVVTTCCILFNLWLCYAGDSTRVLIKRIYKYICNIFYLCLHRYRTVQWELKRKWLFHIIFLIRILNRDPSILPNPDPGVCGLRVKKTRFFYQNLVSWIFFASYVSSLSPEKDFLRSSFRRKL